MSFAFGWESFAHTESFLVQCKSLLTNALNRKKPSIIEDKIVVKELFWGDQSPNLEILEIGDLASDRFRGIFKLTYSGDARITLATKVQANLLHVHTATAPQFTTPTLVGAPVSLTIPLNLTLSDFVVNGIVILVFSKAKGLTLVFRNDPLESIKVSSTFDQLPGIAQYLQSQIETQIRGLFREELPGILYRMSQQWTPSQSEQVVRHLAASPATKPVTFAEIDQEKQVSLVNMLHLEAMGLSRRTLGLSAHPFASSVCRAELRHRQATHNQQPVGLLGEAMYEHVHSQAIKIASSASHKPRRRVIKRRSKQSPAPAAVPAESWQDRPVTPPLRPSSAPPITPVSLPVPSVSVQPSLPVSSALPFVPVPAPAPTQAARRTPHSEKHDTHEKNDKAKTPRHEKARLVSDTRALLASLVGPAAKSDAKTAIFPHKLFHVDDEAPPAYTASF